MPVKALPKISMRLITEYVPAADVVASLDVLYGSLRIRPEWVNDVAPREALQLFVNNNAFIKNLSREFDDAFSKDGTKIGSQLRIRLPNDYQVVDRNLLRLNPDPQLPAPVVAALGAAAVLTQNPEVSCRSLFGGGAR